VSVQIDNLPTEQGSSKLQPSTASFWVGGTSAGNVEIQIGPGHALLNPAQALELIAWLQFYASRKP